MNLNLPHATYSQVGDEEIGKTHTRPSSFFSYQVLLSGSPSHPLLATTLPTEPRLQNYAVSGASAPHWRCKLLPWRKCKRAPRFSMCACVSAGYVRLRVRVQ